MWNRKCEAHPLQYLNKPCGVEVITSQNRDCRPWFVLEHPFSDTMENQDPWWFLGEFKDARVQGKLNVGEHLRIQRISRDEKWSGKSESLPNVLSARTFSRLKKTYITMNCLSMLLIQSSCYFGQRRLFLPLDAFTFPSSSFMFLGFCLWPIRIK